MDSSNEPMSEREFLANINIALQGADTGTVSTVLAAVVGYWWENLSRVELLGWLHMEAREIADALSDDLKPQSPEIGRIYNN